jgi:pimeloyl-ACP methyl ester carboxylesterase
MKNTLRPFPALLPPAFAALTVAAMAAVAAAILACAPATPRPPRIVALPPVRTTLAVESTLASFDGTPIRYRSEGSGQPALLFVHGWAGDRRHWDAAAAHFADRRQVVTLDLPGHGESGKDRREWEIPAYGRDVAAVVQALGLSKVILVGHSMGGAVILEAARLLPGRVIGLVGVDTFHAVERRMDPAQSAALLARWRADYPATARELAGILLPAAADPALRERITAAMLALPPDIGIPLLERLFAYDLAAAFDAVPVPIRAINTTSPTDVEGNRRHSPGFDAVTLPGVGHYPMLEAPARFEEQLDAIVAVWTGEPAAAAEP